MSSNDLNIGNSNKRSRDDDDDVNPNEAENSNKRAKLASATNSPSPADDLICPITLELPWDPVSAEDDRIYDRKAIEKHFRHLERQGQPIRSPYTNKVIGKRLHAMPQIKSLIETLVKTEAISGDLARNWRRKVWKNTSTEDLTRKAEEGDADAMYKLGNRYKDGTRGVTKDIRLAYEWFKKAHKNGNVLGTRNLGQILAHGRNGLPENKVNAVMYSTFAAAKGSRSAALNLSQALTYGTSGLTANKEEAIYWLQRSLSSDGSLQNDMNELGEQIAQDMLEKLTREGTPFPLQLKKK